MMQVGAVCFNAVSRMMPLVRAETARRLVRQGMHQERVAEHLGVSQAMVSKYLRRPPRPDPLVRASLVSQLVEASVRTALEEETRGRIPAWCPLCTSLSEGRLVCGLEPFASVDECARQRRPRSQDRADLVLRNLDEAQERIRRLPFRPLMPEVRSNLAMSLPEAKDARDVAAFPGRLVDIRGEVRGAAPPELGSSTHLSFVLLKVRRFQPRLRAILNTRYDERVRRAVRAAGLRVQVLRRIRGELSILLGTGPPVDAVVDPGAFGVEPAMYVLGESATDVVEKVERLLRHVTDGRGRR